MNRGVADLILAGGRASRVRGVSKAHVEWLLSAGGEEFPLAAGSGPLRRFFVPENLVSVLGESAMSKHGDMACTRYGGELQPTFSLWHKRIEPLMANALLEEKEGGLKTLIPRPKCTVVNWPPQYMYIHPFLNISNTPGDLERAKQLLES